MDKRRRQKKEHSHELDPKEDLAEVDYKTECEVTEITPITFGDLEDKPKVSKKKSSKKTGAVITTGAKEDKQANEDKRKKKPKEDKPKVVPKEAKKKKQTLIQISLGGKKGHQLENQIEGQLCLLANQHPGGQLNLVRGEEYLINFIGRPGSGYELVFTREPVGGKKASILDGTSPIPIGDKRILVLNDQCPDIIYYQEKSRNFLGGPIKVTSPEKKN